MPEQSDTVSSLAAALFVCGNALVWQYHHDSTDYDNAHNRIMCTKVLHLQTHDAEVLAAVDWDLHRSRRNGLRLMPSSCRLADLQQMVTAPSYGPVHLFLVS